MKKQPKDNYSLCIDGQILDKNYNKLDQDQIIYYQSIMDNMVVCVNSCAGTGKTFIAILSALELFRQGKFNHIYYIRIPDDRSLRLGFLPGDDIEKQSIYFRPFYDACNKLGIMSESIDDAIEDQSIILSTDISLRGANIEKSFVIIDESQNGSLQDLKLILTRIADNCKVVMIGHSNQVDNFKKSNDHAFEKYIDHLCQKPWAKECKLVKNYRGQLSSWADKLEI